MRTRPTQKDVAIKAGVSQAAVSMVLSGTSTPAISADTVRRIHAVAKELGYAPNRFAQALKTRRTLTIACIVPDITNPFYPSLVRGVQAIAQDHDYDVITVNTDGLEERERHFLRWAREGRVDGLVGVFFNLRAQDFSEALDAGIPVVRIESSKKAGGPIAIDDIFIDSKAASISVVNYLMEAGHRRIAMIAGSGGPQRVRVEAYLERLSQAGLPSLVVVDEAFSESGGYRAAERILVSDFEPTAIFAANDLMAIGVMQALRQHGLNVPGDVAVVGFDDIPPASLVSPALSTVSQFQDKLGEKAAAILLERLSGDRQGAGVAHEMPYQLIKRESV
ncbi:LacI family DNA-binding transcriptional regulator [Consotaella salsifontis]|uniref:Transcriptional regulator, LacI family n=1 Tax=Consotaella salsifontis TaxID=1365950 RepID=A0A1T4LXW1_9HYPH|nr:LacI family DNA-binding transcriptional regulator [Consotaella salsifontis]SJZ59507.1 transcriptional regulator, LacI family [Consotaella salsifontis]